MKRIVFIICFFCSLALIGQAPVFEWAVQMGGNDSDKGRGIATDHLGNVYVTGEFRDTTDFDPGPSEYILTSAGDYDIFVAKYNPSGQLLWVHSFGGTSYDTGAGIDTDSLGNIFIVGYSEYTSRGIDFDPGLDTFYFPNIGGLEFILKLSSEGSFIWAKHISGISSIGNSIAGGKPIAVNENGSIYLTGSFVDTVDFDPGSLVYNLSATGGADNDIFILKLDSEGSFIWAKAMGGEEDDLSKSIALDSADNVYATGYFRDDADFDPGSGEFIINTCGGQFNRDAFIVKLNSNGDFIWARSIGDCSDNITSTGIAVSKEGEIYTTGEFEGTLDFNPGLAEFNLSAVWETDIFILKLNTEGDFVWAKKIGSWNVDGGYSIALDKNNNVYATGYFDGTLDFDPGSDTFNLTSEETDVFIIKLDVNGDFKWAGSLVGNGGGYLGTAGFAIVLNDWDNIYTTGSFQNVTNFDTDTSNFELTAHGLKDIFIHKMRQQACTSTPLISSNTDFSVCLGEGIPLVATLPISATNISYLWSTGDTSNAILLMPDTTSIYSVSVIFNNDTTVCNSSASVEVEVAEAVIVSTSDDVTICAQEEISLEAGGGLTYTWNTNDSTSNIVVTTDENQIYNVTVTDSNGCTATDSVAVFTHQLSDTTHLDFTTCDTSLVGTTVFTYFDQNGCDSIIVETIILILLPSIPTTPADMVIQDNEPPFQITIPEVLNATSYFWTVPPGVQILSGQGTYAITVDWSDLAVDGSICVSTVNECGSSASDCMNITVDFLDGLNEFKLSGLSVFPNPAEEVLHVIMKDEQFYEVVLLDMLGKRTKIHERFSGHIDIKLNTIPAGVYWLQLSVAELELVPIFVKIDVIK